MSAPIKPLPKRARTGDFVYSAELQQSLTYGFGSAPTFTRPLEMQSAQVEVASQGSSRSLPPTDGIKRRVFFAPGERVSIHVV